MYPKNIPCFTSSCSKVNLKTPTLLKKKKENRKEKKKKKTEIKNQNAIKKLICLTSCGEASHFV